MGKLYFFILILTAAALFIFSSCGDDNKSNVVGPQNQDPVISSVTSNPDTVFVGETSTITVTASDPDGDQLTYTYATTGGTVSGSGNTVTFTAGNIAATATVSVTVSDNRGGEDKSSVSIMIKDHVTRLYLRSDSLSTSPNTGGGSTEYFVYWLDGREWTAAVAGDMVGTQCTFSILMAAPPSESKDAEVRAIIKCGGQRTIIAFETFTVSSNIYTRFVKTMSCQDPQCSNGDSLIVEIRNRSPFGGPLGVLVNTAPPNDSYVEVPSVTIQ